MDKLKMAHEYALEMLKETIPTGSLYGDEAKSVAESIVMSAFALADMMQAEADKRECKERPEVLESVDPKEYMNAVLKNIAEPCNHEWTHIKYFGAEGDFYVCPCGAESKRPQ